MKPIEIACLSNSMLLSMDSTTVAFLCHGAASDIIYFCGYNEPDSEHRPSHGPSAILSERMSRWAECGIHNVIHFQVEFIYSVVEYQINSSHLILRDTESLLLITEALRAYQNWKTKVCQKDQERHGKMFGTGTEFFHKNWTDLNDRIMSKIYR